MRFRDTLLVVAVGGLAGVFLGIYLSLVPICGFAMFMFIVAMVFLVWDRMGTQGPDGLRETPFQSLLGMLGRPRGSAPSEDEGQVLEAQVLEDEGGSGPVPTEEHMVDIYRTVLKLDEERSRALYRAGYARLEDLEGVGVEDLMKVEGINPTIARKIVRSVDTIFKK